MHTDTMEGWPNEWEKLAYSFILRAKSRYDGNMMHANTISWAATYIVREAGKLLFSSDSPIIIEGKGVKYSYLKKLAYYWI